MLLPSQLISEVSATLSDRYVQNLVSTASQPIAVLAYLKLSGKGTFQQQYSMRLKNQSSFEGTGTVLQESLLKCLD